MAHWTTKQVCDWLNAEGFELFIVRFKGSKHCFFKTLERERYFEDAVDVTAPLNEKYSFLLGTNIFLRSASSAPLKKLKSKGGEVDE
jgi:hypothetical protein